MLSQANEADKEAAQQIFSQYENQLKDVADRGDYHNMRWETLNLAQEAANNYASINEKNKAIQTQREAIAKDPRWQTSREQRLKDFELGLKSIQWDPTKRTITNLNVDPYTAAPDVHIMEKSIKYGSVMKPEDIGWKRGYLQYVDFDGKPVSNPMEAAFVNHIVDGKTTETLPADRIKKAVTEALLQDEDVKAVKKRDLKYLERSGEIKFTGDPVKDKAIEDAYDLEHIIKPATAAGQLLKVNNVMDIDDVTQSQGAAFGSGNNNVMQSGVYSPTDQYQPLGAEGRSEFPVMFNDALLGNKAAKVKLMSTLHAMATKDPKAKEVVALANDMFKFSQEYPEYASILNKSTAGKSDWFLASGAQDVMNVLDGLRIAAQGKGNPKVGNAVGKLIERYGKIANSGILDSDFEDQFEQFTTQKQQTRQTPTYSWSVTNPQSRELFNKLREDFNIDKFDIIEGKWEDGENRKLDALTNFTLEPYGGGLGITFEGRDSKGRSVRMVPKKQHETAILGEIAKLVPDSDVLNTNIYKGITPIAYPNIPVKLADLADEIEDSRFAATVKKSYGNNSIMLKDDGSYVMLDPNGKVINQNSSMYKLLPKIYGANNQTKKK